MKQDAAVTDLKARCSEEHAHRQDLQQRVVEQDRKVRSGVQTLVCNFRNISNGTGSARL